MCLTVVIVEVKESTLTGKLPSPKIHSDLTYGSVEVFWKVTSSLTFISVSGVGLDELVTDWVVA